jgi:hypothetical protein
MMLIIFNRGPLSLQMTFLEIAMLDFVGTVATATLIVLFVATVVLGMDAPRSAKLWLAGIAGLWTGLCAAAAAAGWLTLNSPFPLIGLFVTAPLVAAAIAASFPAARQAMLSLPMPMMVGINIGRAVGFLFLLLAAEGRLAGPFPYSAAWGDIITGVVALLLVISGVNGRSPALLTAWNLFGLTDLVLAIGFGVTSGGGSPLQIFHAPPGSAAMQSLPWSFVPTVLVPAYIILHGIMFAKIRQLSSSRRVPA